MSAIPHEIQAPQTRYVSLYAKTPFYGGPEEGGWWGHDIVLITHQQAQSPDDTETIKARFNAAAEALGQEARQYFSMQCSKELDHAEALGIDPDSLPEVDGEATYFVVIEDLPGSHEERGDRTYS